MTEFPTGHTTTEITEKIRDFHEGRIGEDELVSYLDTHHYVSGEDPDEPPKGSSEWYLFHSDGGRSYVPGSWDEVRLNKSVGWLPHDIFQRVNTLAIERAERARRGEQGIDGG
jgi:hypothetical protein